MRKLIGRLCIPLTLIIFVLFTKSTIAEVEDTPLTEFIGTPLPYLCDSWHTSLSNQVFLFELIIDLLVYFLTISTILYLIDRYLISIRIGKVALFSLYFVAISLVALSSLILFRSDSLLFLYIDFKYQPLTSTYKFTLQPKSQTGYESYQLRK
jgi:hypothetical protein